MRHTIVGHGKNGSGIATILKDLNFDYLVYDIRSDISTLQSISQARGLAHVCTREQEVPNIIKQLNEVEKITEIIIHSTMPLGATRKVAAVSKIPLTYIPMFFRERQPEIDVLRPNRIVVGTEHDSTVPAETLKFILSYSDLVKLPPTFMSFEGAELVKLGTNSMRANMISFFNHLYTLALNAGAAEEFKEKILQSDLLKPSYVLDRWETERGWGRNPALIGEPFGGFCLPKDSKYLGIKTVLKE